MTPPASAIPEVISTAQTDFQSRPPSQSDFQSRPTAQAGFQSRVIQPARITSEVSHTGYKPYVPFALRFSDVTPLPPVSTPSVSGFQSLTPVSSPYGGGTVSRSSTVIRSSQPANVLTGQDARFRPLVRRINTRSGTRSALYGHPPNYIPPSSNDYSYQYESRRGSNIRRY